MAKDALLVTAREVAERLHVTEGTVRRWVRAGRITPTVLIGRRLYDMDYVIEALNATAESEEGVVE